MSTPYLKGKKKRPRSSSEPNKSFVKNVTSRVSGLLPATITKWFSYSSSSNTNGSAQVADATDSSTEDEAPESPVTISPPPKRLRYSSPRDLNQLTPVETTCTSTNTESVEESYSSSSPKGRSNIRRDNIFMSTHVNSVNNETSEQTAQEKIFKPEHSLSTIEQSRAKKRKSLFGTPQYEDDTYEKLNRSKSGNVRDPYFKPSLLSSPFYVGRTMYGGASSSYLSFPSAKQRKISITNESSNNDSVTISRSARHIMDLLEHYSSPLVDAKRIPQITRNPESRTSNSSPQQSVNPYTPKGYSYKTQELYVPSVASILTIKRNSRLNDTTNAARQIIASHSSSSDFSPYPKNNYGEGNASANVSGDKLTTKVKSRLTRTNRERDIDNNSDTVNLPNVVLQIDKDNLPKFTFGPISTSQPSQSSSIQTPVIITPEALKRNIEFAMEPEPLKKAAESDKVDFSNIKDVGKDKPVEVTNNNYLYKFSRPVQVSSELNNTTTTPPKFNFGIPESNIEKVADGINKEDPLASNTSIQIIPYNKLLFHKSSDWKCLDCLVMNKIDVVKCVCCGGKKPIELDDSKKCCVCNVHIKQSQGDKCTECEKKTNNVDKPLLTKVTNNAKWKCSDCWVDNNEAANKCVCCGGGKPKKTKPAPVINSVEKTVEIEWKCNDCWIKNKNTLTKCAACGGLKPGSQTESCDYGSNQNVHGNNAAPKDSLEDNKIKEISDTTFKNIAKAQSEKWECPFCLVRNDSNRITCICCEASKPGTEKENNTKFNFHQPSEITFKFGIQPKTQNTSPAIEPEECNMTEESETNNNILPKTPTFNFGLPAKKIGDQSSESVTDKPAEAPKLNFTFGVPKDNPTLSTPNTIFGIPSKSNEPSKNTEEKPQEVPQVFTSPQVEEPPKKTIGLFPTPPTSQGAQEMPALVPLQHLNQTPTVKKDTPFLSTPATNSEAKTQNSFSFSSIVPAVNLFSSAPTTTTASSILAAPVSMTIPTTTSMSLFQKTIANTTTPAPFFQKSESIPTLGVSLFPKTEVVTTTASTGIMQPVFSFGGQGSAPQAEKPKFNFSFSANKTESAPIFKPTFGVSNDNNNSANKFNLPSNSIIGGNTLSGNTLNATSQMNTNNALTTGNPLASPGGSSMFGATVQKENMWSPSNNNLFSANTNANEVQKPPAFTFGTASPFSANNTAFGTTTQQPHPAQPAPNVFGIGSQATTNPPPMFGNHLQNQAAPNIFGGIQVQNNPMPIGMFGSPNPVVTPNFGTMNSQVPSFETSIAPTPAPASFNFGGQPSTGVFGFGQQQNQAPQQPEAQPGMYGFGAPTGPGPQMQFTIGSAPNANTAGRRLRKAMRRTQR